MYTYIFKISEIVVDLITGIYVWYDSWVFGLKKITEGMSVAFKISAVLG